MLRREASLTLISEPKLTAHDFSLLVCPVFFTHGAKVVVMAQFNTTISTAQASNQANISINT